MPFTDYVQVEMCAKAGTGEHKTGIMGQIGVSISKHPLTDCHIEVGKIKVLVLGEWRERGEMVYIEGRGFRAIACMLNGSRDNAL
jgi:hypothetical protein